MAESEKLREQIASAQKPQRIEEAGGQKPGDEDAAELRKRLDAAVSERKSAEEALAQERTTRTTLEKSNQELSRRFSTSEVEKINAKEGELSSNINVATGNIEAIKRDLREAYTSATPDADKIVELQDKLADAKMDLRIASDSKKSFDAWKEKQKTEKPKEEKSQNNGEQQPAHQYSDSDKKWIAAHPRFETDPDYREVVEGAHNGAVRKGMQTSSPAYYEYIESRLKQFGLEKDPDKAGEHEEEEEEEPAVQKKEEPAKKAEIKADGGKIKSGSAVVAPVSYNSPSGSAGKKGKVTLSEGQRRIAINTFGKGTMYNLKDEEALAKYASHL